MLRFGEQISVRVHSREDIFISAYVNKCLALYTLVHVSVCNLCACKFMHQGSILIYVHVYLFTHRMPMIACLNMHLYIHAFVCMPTGYRAVQAHVCWCLFGEIPCLL